MVSQALTAIEYIGSKRIIHRDIASRNCLINYSDTTQLGQLKLKLCDFGSAIVLPRFRKFLISDEKTNLNTRHIPPEAISCKFSLKTDMWSLGILIWEIFSPGQIPFIGEEWETVEEFQKLLNSGLRPEMVLFKKNAPFCIKKALDYCLQPDMNCRASARGRQNPNINGFLDRWIVKI